MNSNFRNLAPFLRTSRLFPDDNPQALSVEINKSYIDIAQAVNARTIGVYALNNQSVNGTTWYLSGNNQKQQGVRKVFRVTSSGSFSHGIDINSVAYFTNCWGTLTDGTNWYGCIFSSNNTIANQVSFYVTPTDIVVMTNGTAPVISSLFIVLEWASKV